MDALHHGFFIGQDLRQWYLLRGKLMGCLVKVGLIEDTVVVVASYLLPVVFSECASLLCQPSEVSFCTYLVGTNLT